MLATFLCAIGIVSLCAGDMPPQLPRPPQLEINAPAPPKMKRVASAPEAPWKRPAPPSVWPSECGIVPPKHLQPVFIQAVQRHGGGSACQVARQACIEERSYNPKAVNPASGTIGIGQFKPKTAAQLGIDPYDAVSSIHGMARYRQWCGERYSLAPAYGRTEDDDEAIKVAVYGRGIGNMRKSQEQFGWLTWADAEPHMPLETQNYVRMQIGDDLSWCPFAKDGA